MDIFFSFLISALSSNLITVSIMFHFANQRYRKTFQKDSVYILSFFLMTIGMCIINYFEVVFWNFVGSIMLTVLCSVVLFYSENKRAVIRFVEMLIFSFILMMCEALGTYLITYLLSFLEEGSHILGNLNMIFSGLMMLFLYYVCISRIWTDKKEELWFKPNRYLVYVILVLYNIINIIFVVNSQPRMEIATDKNILLLNMASIVAVDVYILYFLQYIDEKERLEIKLSLLEQQASMQYNYYNNQENQYREMSKILHDVNKHVTMLEELYRAEEKEKAIEYAHEIKDILHPLLPKQYTNQILLNIILDEKRKQAEAKGIQVIYEIQNIDLHFMKPIEITTVFVNLLENAIEACERAGLRESQIKLVMRSYHQMISIALENTSLENKWKKGRPITSKGGNHGIGLSNVESIVEKYNGTMELSQKADVFCCRLFWNVEEKG